MKELIPAVWDDVDLLNGKRVPATVTVALSLDDHSVELDLTDDHYADLYAAVQLYLKAAQKQGHSRGTTGNRGHSRGTTGNRSQMGAARIYNKAMKEYADAHNLPYTVGAHSKIYWPKGTKAAYAEHLRKQSGGTAAPAP